MKELIDKLLLERLSLAGIARATGVSERWLQDYVNDQYQGVLQQVEVPKKPLGHLTIECDELWSLVGKKANKQWVWLAKDVDSQEIVGLSIGDRSRQGAEGLWNSLPAVYRQCAVSYTDFWEA
jgi:insertion element IS1 protein InsB